MRLSGPVPTYLDFDGFDLVFKSPLCGQQVRSAFALGRRALESMTEFMGDGPDHGRIGNRIAFFFRKEDCSLVDIWSAQ